MKRVFLKEIVRKLLHVSLVACVFLTRAFPNYVRLLEIVLMCLGVLYYAVEQLRLQKKRVPIIWRIHNTALRENEKNQFAYAPLTLLIGIVLVLEFYIMSVANAAIIAVTIGDTAGSVIGMALSHSPRLIWNKKKTYAGTLANAVSVFIVCFLFFSTWKISLITSASSALVESLDLEHVDNLIVPLFVGMILYLTIV